MAVEVSYYKRAFYILTVFVLVACEQQAPTTTDHSDPTSQVAETPIVEDVPVESLLQQCQKCHGSDGNSSTDNSPFIAGLSVDYLKTSMLAYKQNARQHEEKNKLFAAISEKNIDELAILFSKLEPKWDAKKYRKKEKPKRTITKADIQAGKILSTSCKGCHGEFGNSTQSLIPSLAGLQPAYLNSSLIAYFSNKRDDEVMNHFSRAIDKDEAYKLAAYYSTLKREKVTSKIVGNKSLGKKLSTEYCAGCHGMDGNSASEDTPSLTGHHQDYLIKAMMDYKQGSRKHDMMQKAMSSIKLNNIKHIAAFYVSQKPATYKQQKTDTTPGEFNPLAKGEALARACSGCHGQDGNTTLSSYPKLTGLHPDYFIKTINDYISGNRKHEMMKSFVNGLTEDDIEYLSLYFATQEPVVATNINMTVTKATKTYIGQCNGCHGKNGVSTTTTTPSIAGQNAGYLQTVLSSYADKSRPDESMLSALADLNKTDFKNLAKFYSQQQSVKPEVHLPLSPEELSQKCDRCHGASGMGEDPRIPRIGGQVEGYIISAMLNYKNGTRKHSTMFAMANILSPSELKAIARHYSELIRSN